MEEIGKQYSWISWRIPGRRVTDWPVIPMMAAYSLQVERIDTGSAERAAAQADAPELEALLESLHASLADVRTRIGPLVSEVGISLKCPFLYPMFAAIANLVCCAWRPCSLLSEWMKCSHQ